MLEKRFIRTALGSKREELIRHCRKLDMEIWTVLFTK
jgi:hypothetical protein